MSSSFVRPHRDSTRSVSTFRKGAPWIRSGTPSPVLFLSILLLQTATSPLKPSDGFEGAEPGNPAEPLQRVANEFRDRLEISQEVYVVVVPEDERLVSVQRSPDSPKTFLLSIDGSFLTTLDEQELRAAVAHEMGHVWIFTNHPYLHTEALANRIALRLVSRESLERVYEKVWVHQGEKGDPSRFFAD